MKIEIGCLAMIKRVPTDDPVEIEILNQVAGKCVRISGSRICSVSGRVNWSFEVWIPITRYAPFFLGAITSEYLVPLAPPGLTEEINEEIEVTA